MQVILKCVAVPKKRCSNQYLRQLCQKEQLPLCIIAEPVIDATEFVLKAGKEIKRVEKHEP